jgi:hypothetical protein
MGRLPVIQRDSGPMRVGRDHNTFGFSWWLAGGGFKDGCVYAGPALRSEDSATRLNGIGFFFTSRASIRHEIASNPPAAAAM